MGGNSEECARNVAKKDGSTSLPQSDSEVDDDCNNDSGTGDSQVPNKPQRTKQSSAPPYRNSSKHTEMILVCVIVVVSAVVYLWSPTTQDTEKMSLEEAIEHIREEFPSQLEHIWAAFSAGIKETTQGNPTKPSVFMLLYETEEGTAICLAQKVGNMSTHLLNADKFNPLLIIDGADLEHNETLAEDYGTLLEEYRPKVVEQRAMIIINLHKVPGTVAQSFHSLCDTVTPAVDKAVYLFTMKAAGVSNTDNPTEVAEKQLRKLWSDELDEDRLNPLITRITDMTMMIRPEKNLAPC